MRREPKTEEEYRTSIEHRLTRVEVLIWVSLALSFAHLILPGLP